MTTSFGYEFRGDSGVENRIYFRRGKPSKYHVHVQALGNENLKRQVITRAYLTAQPEEAAAYGKLKLLLVETLSNDRRAYLATKKPYIESMVERGRKYFAKMGAALDVMSPATWPFPDILYSRHAGAHESACSVPLSQSSMEIVPVASSSLECDTYGSSPSPSMSTPVTFRQHSSSNVPITAGSFFCEEIPNLGRIASIPPSLERQASVILSGSCSVSHSQLCREVAALIATYAAEEEPAISLSLQALANDPNLYCTLYKFEHRLKTASSLERKLALNPQRLDYYQQAKALQVKILHAGAMEGTCPLLLQFKPVMYDALRYTLTFRREHYVHGIESVYQRLAQQSIFLLHSFNFWPAPHAAAGTEGHDTGPADGPATRPHTTTHTAIHSFFETQKGFVFEVQFHTEESLAVAISTRALYEASRQAHDAAARQALLAQLAQHNAAIPVPPGNIAAQGILTPFPPTMTDDLFGFKVN